MMKKFTTICFSLLVLFAAAAFTVADDPFITLLKKLEEFTKKYPNEKVYLHLDKPYYAIGDDIWFKAYVTDSRSSEPTNISQILYVELIDQKDSLQKQLKLQMQSGITWGDFKLSDSLSEGNYRIRAYTQWMRNAGPQFFFDKTIKIGNSWANKVFTKTNYQVVANSNGQKVNSIISFKDKGGKPYINCVVNYDLLLDQKSNTKGITKTNGIGEVMIAFSPAGSFKQANILATITLADGQKVSKNIPIRGTSPAMDIQFFPEGGNLVDGIPSTVAVKALNSSGRGEQISGKIVDNEGTEILDFETAYLGMGTFALTPMAGKTYSAQIKFANGTQQSISLPKVQNSGYVLSVNNSDSIKISARIMLSPDLLNKGELNLLAQQNGKILFTAKIPTARQIAALSFPKTGFPSGIITLTLFDTQNLPVTERIIFVDNSNDKIDVELEGLKNNYTKRANVELGLLATHNQTPTQGSFSIAVTDLSAIEPDLENESNILTGLLLTPDLTGYIEKPNHYFLKNDVKTRTELDNLLLTQGWRKINWKAISNEQFPVNQFAPEKSLKISGTVTMGGKPVVKGKVSIFSNSKGIFAADTLTDNNGRFNFDQISFTEGVRFVVKALSEKDSKNVKIVMDDVEGQAVTASRNNADIEINVNETMKTYLEQSSNYFEEQEKRGFLSRVTNLKAVEIIGEKVSKVSNSSNLNGPGNADAVFTAEDLKNSASLSNFLNGKVAGLTITNGLPGSTRNGRVMTVYVDGVLFIDGQNEENTETLDNITLLDIESLEVLKSTANTTLYGHAGANGVIIITTKTGTAKSVSEIKSPGILNYSTKGYYAIRQFYSPQYDTNSDPKPDLRTTVYWNPHLVSDTHGKASFNIFNTDQAGTYRIVVEGIDAVGNLARKIFTYQVK